MGKQTDVNIAEVHLRTDTLTEEVHQFVVQVGVDKEMALAAASRPVHASCCAILIVVSPIDSL